MFFPNLYLVKKSSKIVKDVKILSQINILKFDGNVSFLN